HHARRSLDPELGAELVVSAGELLALSATTGDVDEFPAAAFAAPRAADPAAPETAPQLYPRQPPPPDPHQGWAIAHRHALRGDHAALLEELAGMLESRGELDRASRAATALVAAEPLREDAHLRLIRLAALAGRRTDATRRYEELRAVLARDLGTEPSAEA